MSFARPIGTALVLLAGCSGAYVAGTAAPDAASPADATVLDATGDAPPVDGALDAASTSCDPRAPFTTIEPVDGLNSAADEVGLAITDRGLTAYVVTAESIDGSYGRSIGVAKRASTSAAWGPVVKVPSLATPGRVFDNPSLPADGRTLFVEANGPNSLDIFAIPRNAAGEVDFSAAKSVVGLSTVAAWEFDSYVTRDGRTVYFGSNRSSDYAIFQATLSPEGAATRVDSLLVLSKNGTEQAPIPTPDGTALYFTRKVDRQGGGQHADIFVSLRDSSGELTDGTPVSELLTDGTDYPVDISEDGCSLYFASDARRPSLGATDLYVAKKVRR
jgi:hypothetical protein